MHKLLKTIWTWMALAVLGGVCLPSVAWPANADIAIYREVTGAEDEDNQTIHDEAFDTTVRQDGEFTKGGSDILVDLATGGHYYAWYTLHFIATSGTDRTEHVGHLDLAGTDLEAGYGSGYKRGAEGVDEVYISGGAIIQANAGDDIKVEAQNTSAVTTNNLQRRANLNGLMLLKLDDDWDYLRLHETTGGTNYNSATFTGFTWDTQDEVDAGSFSHTGGNANVTLEQAGHYLVTYTIHLNTGTTSQRIEMTSRLQINGTTQEHCYSGTYIRGNNNAHGTNDGVIAGTCIVNNATGGNDLVVQIARTGPATTTINDVGDQSGLTIVKLPDDADYIRIHESGGGQSVDVTDSPVTYDTNDEVDAAFTHSTSTNTDDITINSAGDYLLTGCTRSGRASGTNRYAVLHEWRVNSTKRQYGGFGWYNRGDQGTD
ncbi:MAG: hypothetical protein K8I00_09905, partial [Candidatus Omnitrophica bacterium]|nr:hypothetical protein [Candidatus Omnitrophota bacterium]